MSNTLVGFQMFQHTTPCTFAPVASFSGTPLIVTAGDLIQFTDSSINTPTSWLWEYSDGTTLIPFSTVQNPLSPLNSIAGLYYIRLTVSNACGSDIVLKKNYIRITN